MPEGRGLQSTLRRGWYWGSQQFREGLLDCVSKGEGHVSNRNYRSSAMGRDHRQKEAQEWLEAGLEHFGLQKPPPGTTWRRDHHPERMMIAWALAKRTEARQRWIAAELGLASAGNVSQQIRRLEEHLARQPKITKRANDWLERFNRR